MAFFNLTMLGPDNMLKERRLNKTDSVPCLAPAQNSYLKNEELKKKHVRTGLEPNQVYTRPVTCSQQVGWWTKDKGKDMKWAKVEKHVFPKSEMTSFVDSMTLADKSFRLY